MNEYESRLSIGGLACVISRVFSIRSQNGQLRIVIVWNWFFETQQKIHRKVLYFIQYKWLSITTKGLCIDRYSVHYSDQHCGVHWIRAFRHFQLFDWTFTNSERVMLKLIHANRSFVARDNAIPVDFKTFNRLMVELASTYFIYSWECRTQISFDDTDAYSHTVHWKH